MAKGPLRRSIEDMIWSNFEPEGGPGWWGRVKTRWNHFKTLFEELLSEQPWAAAIWWTPIIPLGIIYSLTGAQFGISFLENKIAEKLVDDPSKLVSDVLEGIFDNEKIIEFGETIGALITTPIVTMLESYAGKEDIDPLEMARTFHGFMIGLNITAGIANSATEAATAGTVKGVGKMIESMYWSLGLGFLGWQTLAPLLSSGLQPNLDRYYNKLYRPNRFSASELRDLFALGKIGDEAMKEAAREIGWRDQDIQQWIDLAYRNLNEGDIWQAYHAGEITETEATIRLRVLGYNPADIPLLYKLNPKKDVSEERDFSISNARKAYREALISAAELRSILEGLNYSAAEVDIILQIEDLNRIQETKGLTQSQIHAAWMENVITDPEARHWLEEAGFGTPEIEIILDTWTADAVPEFRKLNLGTITGAYVEGVINRSEALSKLESIGLAPDDAALELNLVEKRNPEAFGEPPKTIARYLTASMLADLVGAGLMTPDQMSSRLVLMGYTQEDALLLSEAASARMTAAARPLPQRSIERAYVAGVLTREQSSALLVELGLSPINAAVVLDTLEAEEPAAFGAPIEERYRLISAGALEDLRVAGLISSDEMTLYLLGLNYAPADAALLVDRAEQLSVPWQRPLTSIQVERAYLAGVLTREGAIEQLIEIDYTPEAAEQIIRTTETEHPNVFDPTAAQSMRLPSISALAAAVRNGIITDIEYFNRTIEIGYAPEDAAVYLALATKQERKSIRTLSAAQVVATYDAGIMSWSEALTRITQQGYNQEDAALLLRTRKDVIENTDTWFDLLEQNITAEAAIMQLVNAGYADEDILAAFASIPPDYLAAANMSLDYLAQLLQVIPGGR